MAADMAVLQLVRFVLKLGRPEPADTLLQFCGFNHRTEVMPLARNANCRLDHTEFHRVPVDVPLESLSLAELARRLTQAPPAPGTQFEVGGWEWIEFAACNCGQAIPVQRFVPRGNRGLPCCSKCSAPRVALDFYTHRAVSAAVLGSAIDQPLRQLGAFRVSSVAVRTADIGALATAKPLTPNLL
jgi:hypothetical protein